MERDPLASTAPAGARAVSGIDRRLAILAVLLLLGGTVAIGAMEGGRQGALYLLGAALGLVLYHAAFGFASSWRAFVADGEGRGLRAQMLMLALATVIFLPLLEQGSFWGRPVAGALAPVGLSVAAGACLFGVGMQLGGGCASGTLYSLGGGSVRMIVTLVFFMAGSLIGTAHLPWWLSAPQLGTVSLAKELGLPGALALQFGIFFLVVAATLLLERLRRPRRDPPPTPPDFWHRLYQGPWPLLAGAVALALLNVATLGIAGHPWTVSFGYTLWGAKIAEAAGLEIAAWPFWTWSYPGRALAGSIFANTTSVMNFGILAGAFLAASLAGRFRPGWRQPWRPLMAAALGGLLMGYGARLAFGCNVGAYFSGVASGSLHGWLWFASALAGTFAGNALRPLFGLSSVRPPSSAAQT